MEAELAGIPALCVTSPLIEAHSAVFRDMGFPVVSTADELASGLASTLADPHVHRACQDMEDEIGVLDGRSSDRVSDLLLSLVQG